MTANEIIRLLMRNRLRRHMLLPNYTPRNWWECDLFELTRDGFYREYEIKLSLKDFQDDARKRKLTDFNFNTEMRDWEVKHELIKLRSPRAPVLFWFVSPRGIIRHDLIPEWAGHIEIDTQDSRLIELETKAAPRLHKSKFSDDPKRMKHFMTICYFRFHRLYWKSCSS
jgi:hypothetical protein